MGEWLDLTLGDLVSFQRGHDLPADRREAGRVPVMGSFGVTGHHSVSKAKGPGVIVGRSGASAGVVSYTTSDYWPLNTCLFSTNFHGNDPRFVFYFLRTLGLGSYNSGSAQPSLNRNFISPIPIRVPKPAEQRAIAEVLSMIDDKIELNRRTNETLEGMAQSIFRDWFVDFGPVRRKQAGATYPVEIMGGLTTDLSKASELASLFPAVLDENEVPAGWELRAIGDVVEISGGSTPSTAQETLWQPAIHRWATPKDLAGMSDLALFDTGRRISDEGLAGITSGLLPAGTVLLSSRAPIGYLAIAQQPVAINQGFIALKPTKDFGSAYLYEWCKANMEAIVANANGSTFQEISKKNFRPIASALPADSAIVRAFCDLAAPLVDRIVCAATENRTLAETRDYLLPRLMSGAIRVAEIAA